MSISSGSSDGSSNNGSIDSLFDLGGDVDFHDFVLNLDSFPDLFGRSDGVGL